MSSMSDKVEQPTDEMNEAIGPDVDIPGPYPSGRGDPTGKPLSTEPEPTKATRGTGSLGSLTKAMSTSTVREETGGLGSPICDDERDSEELPQEETVVDQRLQESGQVKSSRGDFAAEGTEPSTPQEKIEKARAGSFPAGVPEDADVGTGRAKGTGLPPGSVGKGHTTPQTPPT